MLEFERYETGRPSEFGVGADHFDRERNFVDNTLPSRLPLAPKFKIAGSVVDAVSVFVVNSLVRLELTSEKRRHHFSMLEYFFAPAKIYSHVSRRVSVSFRIYWSSLAPFVTAFSRTKPLLVVVARVSAVFGFAKVAVTRLAAEFALKSRYGSIVHGHWLSPVPRLVKEIV